MAKTSQKVVENMSEVREENGNGKQEFVISAVDSEFDIVVRVNPDDVEGCDFGSIIQMVNRSGYSHIMSQEAYSAAGKFDGADKEAFMKEWRTKKRQSIMDGTYVGPSRGGPRGPRMSEFDRELNLLAYLKAIKPAMANPPPDGKTPKQKDLINEQPFEHWINVVRNSPKWQHLHDLARQNIAARAAEAAADKAQVAADEATAFANLA